MTSINIPPTIYPIPQATWVSIDTRTKLPQLIQLLNRKLLQWRGTIEAIRQGVSGPRWQLVQTVTAASTLAPLGSSIVPLDATAGAFATTLYLSTAPEAFGSILIFKRLNGGGNSPTIITQTGDTFLDTGGTTLTLSSQYQTVRLYCDGAGHFAEW